MVPSSLVDVRCVELVPSSTLERPEGPSADPEGAKGRGSRRMFWELAPGGVFEKDVDSQCPKTRRAWEPRKIKMEKASRWIWQRNAYNTRTKHLREYTLKEFWEIFVDDCPIGADALLRQENVHSKAVFSYEMTLMDKIRGWEG